MKALVTAICAFGAAFGLTGSVAAADTYAWTASGDGIGANTYVKIADDVGAFNGRLRLVGFSTAEGEYTVTSNRVHVTESSGGTGNGLPTASYVHQMSAGARFDGTTTKSIRVQLAQPANSYALYARITAVTEVSGDHMDSPDLRKDFESNSSTAAADLAANAVTKIVVGVANETIAYWPFGENGFSDVSGNGHDLVGVEISESDAAYISLNDGRSDQYLKTASALDLSKETAVTFECWCRQTAHPASTYNIVFASETPAVGTGGFVLYNAGQYQVQMRVASDGWQLDYTTDTGFADGMWHHVAYVVDRSRTDQFSCRLYIDGVRQTGTGRTGSVTYDMSVPALFNSLFMIGGGAAYSTGSNYYRGYIDDVRISRGVVAPEDFLKYPTVGKKMRANDGKLPVVAYWPFGGKRGRDVTGNGFDLTMDTTVPMLSGTPNTVFGNRSAYTNFYLATFPFSAFSTAGMTIECFAKSDSGSTTAGNILGVTSKYYDNPGAFRFGYDANFKVAGITFRLPTSDKYAYSKTTEADFGALNDNRWRHFAAVYDPSKSGAGIVTFYVDGVAAPSGSDVADQAAFALKDAMLYFSRAAQDVTAFYGQFDDVRITAGALTPDKFLSSRSAASTVALYRFDNGSIEDVTGNGHSLTFEGGSPVFEETPSSFAGCSTPGLRMNGATRFYTTAPVDLTGTKAMTIEFDYNRNWNNDVYVMAASADVSLAGGFTFYRTSTKLQAQFRPADNASWAFVENLDKSGTSSTGFFGGRFSVDGNASPVAFNLNVDGVNKSKTSSVTISNLGNQQIYFGGCPTYQANYRFTGYFYRIAISDVALDPADYVLDNLIDPEVKRTLAYWDFRNYDGLTVVNGATRGSGLVLDGNTSAATTNLTLSALTQTTVECFVRFSGKSTGTILSLGSGVGSFSVASDATAGTLTGTFIPYDHLAASNGGIANLADVADRSWHHVALVIDRTKSGADAVRFYVDYERATPAGRAWDKAATILDGVLSVGDGFTGRIDDVRVSAGALEPDEFLQERTGGPDGTVLSFR